MAPSQFEINYSYAEAVAAADTIALYKFICRQIAFQMGMTASFLPKPIAGIFKPLLPVSTGIAVVVMLLAFLKFNAP